MHILSIILTYIKKYRELFLILLGAFVYVMLYRRQKASFVDDIKKINDAHQEEIKKINDARLQERARLEENERVLRATLDAVQRQYDDAKKELDVKKKKEIESLVNQFGDKPDELAKKLSEVTGFDIVLSR